MASGILWSLFGLNGVTKACSEDGCTPMCVCVRLCMYVCLCICMYAVAASQKFGFISTAAYRGNIGCISA